MHSFFAVFIPSLSIEKHWSYLSNLFFFLWWINIRHFSLKIYTFIFLHNELLGFQTMLFYTNFVIQVIQKKCLCYIYDKKFLLNL